MFLLEVVGQGQQGSPFSMTNRSIYLITLTLMENLFTISWIEALTSSIVMLPKIPSARSF